MRGFLFGAIGSLLMLSSCGGDWVTEGVQKNQRGNVDAAMRVWGKSAKFGNTYAMNNIGVVYRDVYNDGATASQWFLLAAQRNNPLAMYNLAQMQYAAGFRDAAISWLYLASRWGEPRAASALRNIGVSPPSADLQQQQQAAIQQQQAEREENEAALIAMGLGIAACAKWQCEVPGPTGRRVVEVPASRQPTCQLNPVFKDMFGNPRIDCR